MKIAIIQQDLLCNNAEYNIRKADEAIGKGGCDLYVLPEMFATGFVVDDTIDMQAGRKAVMWMTQKAASINAAMAGSLAWEGNGKRFNRFFFIKPDGEKETYNKHHLFAYGGENLCYTAGERRVIVAYKGLRFLLQICYDLRFPVFSRNRNDYDTILYVANWPASRSDVWKTLLKARAMENQCYVVGVNRTGSDKNCAYSGCSAIIDPYGNTLVQCPPDEEGIASADMNQECLKHFRNKFRAWIDADQFELKTKQHKTVL